MQCNLQIAMAPHADRLAPSNSNDPIQLPFFLRAHIHTGVSDSLARNADRCTENVVEDPVVPAAFS